MSNSLVLLPGWGLGIEPLGILQIALECEENDLQVQLEPLPEIDSSVPGHWLDELDARLPDGCWLGGWSLGGMLATELAARRQDRCAGLIAMAANSRFVASEDWPHGMPPADFADFMQRCEKNPAATLRRFARLCTKGGDDAEHYAQLIISSTPSQTVNSLMNGLRVLAALDVREAITAYQGPQLHMFGDSDALVPEEAASGIQSEIRFMGGCHAFQMEQAGLVAEEICRFWRRHNG